MEIVVEGITELDGGCVLRFIKLPSLESGISGTNP